MPGLFEGTAWYYSRFRRGYPPDVIDFLVDRGGLDHSTPVLDLGCGTGQIGIPLAARGVPVYAVDPDLEMIAEGRRSEQRSGVGGVTWMVGDDKSLHQLNLGPVVLCAMGASFHWMDREALLATLDRLVTPDGAIAILSGEDSVWSEEQEAWRQIVKEVVKRFLGPERRAGDGRYSHPKDRHEVVLARSPFGNVERQGFTSPYKITADDIVGFQLSTSFASPAQLGSRTDEFKHELKSRLLGLSPTGMFGGLEKTEVLLAKR